VSLISLNRSRSISSSPVAVPARVPAAQRLPDPVSEQRPVRQPGQRVVQPGVAQLPLPGAEPE